MVVPFSCRLEVCQHAEGRGEVERAWGWGEEGGLAFSGVHCYCQSPQTLIERSTYLTGEPVEVGRGEGGH